MPSKKRIISKKLASNNINKPDTITRAGITANLQFTRGKQLVEHKPRYLIPDPQNPRPGEVINDAWLEKHLKISSNECLCRVGNDGKNFIIPEISELGIEYSEELENDYNFLRDLAFSIRLEGLIKPIEVFLADNENAPEYFNGLDSKYGYVVLEGHQRRLAAIMGCVEKITCIEITDETLLAKLKVKHRKLRRQLSENNLRKDLSPAQNFEIVSRLLKDEIKGEISARELSGIIGLNEKIAQALKSIIKKSDNYPKAMFERIEHNSFTYKDLRRWSSMSYQDIQDEISSNKKNAKEDIIKKPKPRGKSGGSIKKSAVFKVKTADESIKLQNFFSERIPEVKLDLVDNNFKSLENLLNKIKEFVLEKY